ncbi:hypothetical protein G4Y79_05035 [Phototrophicus methaneseepsis]|uniref:Uncharacterized protein n=1 Tax=Phototrophicus methaneseepsis TaxID=2710758 RepID=A0A7S8IEJ8_9CHLR|nr:hypothetical protein [Phototrophicus methaneseepsis]QPC83745.1 hypothetical protein G4Y79_05035 [Phototrophicus methaneseepsis]
MKQKQASCRSSKAQTFHFPSSDGAQLSMFITHKRGLELDGTHPTVNVDKVVEEFSDNFSFLTLTIGWSAED